MNVRVADEKIVRVEPSRYGQGNSAAFVGLVIDDAGGDHIQVSRRRLLFAAPQIFRIPRIVIVQYGDEGGWFGGVDGG